MEARERNWSNLNGVCSSRCISSVNGSPCWGISAFATVLASRSLCYWNPMTGELRNTIETEMGELGAESCRQCAHGQGRPLQRPGETVLPAVPGTQGDDAQRCAYSRDLVAGADG